MLSKIIVLSFLFIMSMPSMAQNDGSMMHGMHQNGCMMCTAGMVLGGLFILAAIVLLLSLSLFLIRRSRTTKH